MAKRKITVAETLKSPDDEDEQLVALQQDKHRAHHRGKDLLPLRLEWRSPIVLPENPKNWRRHPDTQVTALTDVIAEVGWAGACLYNETTQRLIDGHLRRMVGQARGDKLIP